MRFFDSLVRTVGQKGLSSIRLLLLQYLGSLLPYDFETTAPMLLIYDFIVVGSGPAGSVVASRLSETGAQVLLLEAGASALPESAVPGLFPSVLISREPIWWMRSESQAQFQTAYTNNSADYLQGKVMGGGSTINAMIYSRGSPHDYDAWANMGNVGWDFESVLPYFKKLEDFRGYETINSNLYHGRGGPLRVSIRNHNEPILKLAVDAYGELGVSPIDDGVPDQIGIAPLQATVRDGIRDSASESYLRPVVQRTNLHIRPNCMVVKLHFDKAKRAVGVEYIHEGKAQFVRVRKEVIVSGGAINTPKLLMLSGIGPEEHLREMGIPIVAAVEGVGRNLRDHHSSGGIPLAVKPGVALADLGNPLRVIKQYFRERTGPLSAAPGATYNAFINLSGDVEGWPDTNLFLNTLSAVTDRGIITNLFHGLKQKYFDALYGPLIKAGEVSITMAVGLTRPKSSGWVRLRSTDPNDHPIIDLNYFSNQDDLRLLTKGIHHTFQKILQTSTFRDVIGARYISKPIPGCRHMRHLSEQYWECFARATVSHAAHSAGTCKMAPDSDPLGVVTDRLRLRGVTGVRVIDSSVMPDVSTGNLMATVYMVGEKGADLVKEDYGYSTDPLQ